MGNGILRRAGSAARMHLNQCEVENALNRHDCFAHHSIERHSEVTLKLGVLRMPKRLPKYSRQLFANSHVDEQ